MDQISAFAAYRLNKPKNEKKKNKNVKSKKNKDVNHSRSEEELKRHKKNVKKSLKKQEKFKKAKIENGMVDNDFRTGKQTVKNKGTPNGIISSTPNGVNQTNLKKKSIRKSKLSKKDLDSLNSLEVSKNEQMEEILKSSSSSISENMEHVDLENYNNASNNISVTEKDMKVSTNKKDKVSNNVANNLKSNNSKILRNNSVQDGEGVFKWIINPIDLKTFFNEFWEKHPCLIQRDYNEYFSNLISFEMIDRMLLENHVEFTKNIDITKYENGIRETLNPDGRALPGVVWEKYAEGCSIRILNPQTFLPSIFGLNSTLQEFFHCMVGANVYLTPPNSQGFAPHYDDIEAFVLQIEGKKEWKLYNPRFKNEELPRFSSPNFSQDEIGEPILENTLEPGHILYFPRGTIHQANTVPGCHSLHITLSFYQRQSYADLCEKLFPLILEKAIQEDIELRKGLPFHIWDNIGTVHSDTMSNEREEVIKHVSRCIKRAIYEIPIDDAVDQLAKKFQHEALPPDVTNEEMPKTIFGCKNYLDENGEVVSDCEITQESRIRLLRAHILRLIKEEDTYRIYYYADNSKEYKEYEPNYIEIEKKHVSTIEVLVKCYPDYAYVKDLPLKDAETKLAVAQTLWDRGLLMLRDT